MFGRKAIDGSSRLAMTCLVAICLVPAIQVSAHEQSNTDPAYTFAVDASEGESSADALDIDWQEYSEVDYPTWSAKAGAVILKREQPRATPLLVNAVGGATVLNASDFNFNWDGGLDMTLMRQWSDGDALEVRYFGVDGWSAQQSFFTPSTWYLPTSPPAFGYGGAFIDAVYTSRLYSTEINFRRQALDWLTVLAGFRWLEFHEQLTLGAQFDENDAVIGTNTDNHLYGGQLGLDARIWSSSRLEINAYAKAGVYLNCADQSFYFVQAVGPSFSAGQGLHTDAFVGELGASGNYWLTDRLALRAGYQLLWLESVAVASDQFSKINLVSNSGIHVGGSAFFHGVNVGMEYLW